jgi:cobalt-zinc-cadmium efflux system membrane fusion protein
MNRTRPNLVLAVFLSLVVAVALPAEEEHGHDEAPGFSVADFERHGVVLATAAAGVVDVGLELPADVRPDADRVAHLAPRFPGIVREVRKQVGDRVRAGEVLARIESDNLADFTLSAAFAGTVLARHIAPGETVAPASPAFIVADLSTVWVDIHAHQKALAEIRVGQPVRIASRDETLVAEGVISYITPVLDPTTRTATARVVLANPDGTWRPGLFVLATVDRGVEAAVVVPRRALHRDGGRTVVYVATDGAFTARPVTLGAVGRLRVEVATGLSAGERVADENSFLVKAELEKGSAEHDH